jgi:hypothetical protein
MMDEYIIQNLIENGKEFMSRDKRLEIIQKMKENLEKFVNSNKFN